MENAAKALLIAAGVLVGLIVISLIMVSYMRISNYYNEKEKAEISEQLIAFNEQYISYNREDVRGTDIISLVNKIINFNTLKEEEPITIEITIYTKEHEKEANSFYYGIGKPGDSTKVLIDINKVYASHPGIGQKYIRDMFDSAIALESNNNYSQGRSTKLAANMSTLMGENTRKDPMELLKELKINATKADLPNIQNDILKYYQYNQFKRAHFNCTELKYTSAGRVKSFNFEFNGTFE